MYASEKQIRVDAAVLDAFCYRIIAERQVEFDKPTSKTPKRKDILSMFLRIKDQQALDMLKKDKEPPLTESLLRDIIMSFVLAGRDTTTCTLSFLFAELAKQPALQAALYAEVLTVPGAFPTQKDLKKRLPFLNGCLFESLRMYPSVATDPKMCVHDDVLPGGLRVAAGTRVVYENYAMGRDPKVWDRAGEFLPERWIPFKVPDPFEFPVFQAGGRVCLGQVGWMCLVGNVHIFCHRVYIHATPCNPN